MRKIFLLATEPSGDQLGARLASAMREAAGDQLELVGMGGPAMAEQRIEGPFDTSELAVMGLVEVVPMLPRLMRRIGRTARWIVQEKPDAVVTIDSPDFMHRVVARARPHCPKTAFVNYVAPTVWMWRAGRARRVAQLYDLQLALLPFEPPYFEKEGLRCEFVGHPAIEARQAAQLSKQDARRLLGFGAEGPVVVVLPGSRQSEIHRHGRVFGDALDSLARRKSGLEIVLPMAPGVEEQVRQAVESWNIKPVLLKSGQFPPYDRWAAYAAADVALAASGTVTAELAAADTPMVVAYRMSSLTWAVLRGLARMRFASLVNLLLDEETVPEYLQGLCKAEPIANTLAGLLEGSEAANRQRMSLGRVSKMLWGHEENLPPSKRAAMAVLKAAKLAM